MNNKIMCLRQFIRPNAELNMKIEGFGDCVICKPDEKNALCKGYVEIQILTLDTGEDDGYS